MQSPLAASPIFNPKEFLPLASPSKRAAAPAVDVVKKDSNKWSVSVRRLFSVCDAWRLVGLSGHSFLLRAATLFFAV